MALDGTHGDTMTTISTHLTIPASTRAAIEAEWPEEVICIDNLGRISWPEHCPGHTAMWRAAERLVHRGVLVRRATFNGSRTYRLADSDQ